MAFEPFTEHFEDTDGDEDSPARRGLVLLTVQRDGDLAGEWHDALLAEGIAAELHIRDAASFSPTSSVYPTGAPFVYVLFVPRQAREQAARLLIELGWDGRGIPRSSGASLPAGGALRGALFALAGAAGLVALLILLRGG